MFCRTCSNEVNDKAVVCLKCGVPPMKGNEYCYSCGAKTQPNAVICVSCGVGFKGIFNNPINGNLEDVIKKPTFWAAVVLLVSFFLPWLDALILSISGWQLRDLARLLSMDDDGFILNFLIYLMYLLPIISIIIIISYFTENAFIHKTLNYWKTFAGVYPWLFFILMLSCGIRFTDYIAYGFIITLVASSYLLYDAVALYRKNNHNKEKIANENLAVTHIQNTVNTTLISPSYNKPASEISNHSFTATKSNKNKILIGLLIGVIIILGISYLLQIGEITSVLSPTTENNTAKEPVQQPSKPTQETSPVEERKSVASSNLFSGTKKFCDGLGSWYYLVTINGSNITLKSFADKKNSYHKNKTTPTEVINGVIKDGKIITKDAPEYLTNRFRFENGVLIEINNEGGDNPYTECY